MGGIEDLAKERARRRPSRLASEDEAAALLAKYSIVTLGSAGRVMYWTRRDLHEGDEALAPEFLSEAAFKLFFRGRFHLTRSRDGDEKRTPLSGYLLDRMQRYAGVVYSPNGPAVSRTGKVNLWRGFGVLPAEGTWSLMRAHLNEVIASGDSESARYILRWLAWCVQHPGERAEVALVVRGKRGMGKGTLGNAMCRVFGAHGVHLSNQKHLTAGFNRHLMHCSFLFADEAFWPGDKSGEGELKRIITEPTLFIEPKGLDGFTVRNCLHPYITSNEAWVVPAAPDERRFAVFDIEDERPRAESHFRALYAELAAGGLSAMLYDLLHEDLGNWHPRLGIPQTKGLLAQKEESLSGIDALVASLAHDGCLPFPIAGKPHICSTLGESEHMGLWAYAKTVVPGLRHKVPRVMVTALRHWGCEPWHCGADRGIKFPPLAELRQRFVAEYGPQAWDTNRNDWGV